jgi:hypothetical protein
MATYDFTGSNGDPLPAGLTAQNGTFEIWSNKLRATGSDPGGAKWIATGISTADGTFSCIFNGEGSSGDTTGVVCRYSDNNNHWSALLNSGTGLLRLFKRELGSYASQGTDYTIPAFSNTTDYKVSIVASGTSLTVQVDDIDVITDAGAQTFNQTELLSGLRIGNTTHSIDTLIIPDAAASDSITVAAPFKTNAVYQMNASDVYPQSFSITYSGTPTTLRYRLLDARDDTTEVIGWTVFDASPTGGTSTLNFNAPKNIFGYHVEVDFSNDAGVSDLQTLDWYVGHLFNITGQSLADDMSTVGSITAALGHLHFNGTNFAAPTLGAGEKAFVDGIIAMYGCAVAVTNSGVGGSPMTFEADSDTNNWSNSASTLFTTALSYVSGMTNTANKLAGMLHVQGQRDSIQGVSEATYLRINESGGLNRFLMNCRDNWTFFDDTALPISIGTLGRNTTTSTDIKAQPIRNALLSILPCDSLLQAIPLFHVDLSDQLHPTEAGYQTMGDNFAANVSETFGDVDAKAPQVLSITNNAGYTEFTLEFNKDLDTTDTTYDIEGVRVEDNGTPVTVSSFVRQDTRKIKITLGSAVSTTATVRFYLGYGTGLALADSTLIYPRGAAVTLPNAAGTYKPYVNPFNVLATEIV